MDNKTKAQQLMKSRQWNVGLLIAYGLVAIVAVKAATDNKAIRTKMDVDSKLAAINAKLSEDDREVSKRLRLELEQKVAVHDSQIQYYNALIDQTDAGLVAVDEHGKVIQWNGRASALFGYSYEEIVGQSLEVLMWPGETRERHRRGMKAAFASNDPRERQIVECTGRTKTGGKQELVILAGVYIDKRTHQKIGIAEIRLKKFVKMHLKEET